MSVTAETVVVRHIFHTFPQTADCLLYHSRTFIPDGSVALTQDSQQLQPNWNAADAKKGDFSEVVWRADGSHHSALYCTVKTSCCCEAVCLCSTSTACREKKHFKPYFGSKFDQTFKESFIRFVCRFYICSFYVPVTIESEVIAPSLFI